MTEPRTPPQPGFDSEDDAGFPPLRVPGQIAEGEEDSADDGDFHEEGGGD